MTRPSIYEAAGGMPAFVALAAAHHERCLADPELEHAFSHGGKHDHLDRLAAYWAEVLGGPPTYSQAYGGHSAMVELHAGEGIGSDWSRRFVDCFVGAADDAGLPADPDLRAALRAYMEWATPSSSPTPPRARWCRPRWRCPTGRGTASSAAEAGHAPARPARAGWSALGSDSLTTCFHADSTCCGRVPVV